MEFIGRFIISVSTEQYLLLEDLSCTGGEEKKNRCTFIGLLKVAVVKRGNVLIST